jgi:hypothetical protein
MKYLDTNQEELKKGDIINLHQTVNGQNMFVVLNTEPLDIRYAHDLQRLYEYDKEENVSSVKIYWRGRLGDSKQCLSIYFVNSF